MAIKEHTVLMVSSLNAVTGMARPPSNSQLSQPFQNLECHHKHVDFFIQALLYTFSNSQYDLRGFLFDLMRNFKSYCYSHIFDMLIFGGKIYL